MEKASEPLKEEKQEQNDETEIDETEIDQSNTPPDKPIEAFEEIDTAQVGLTTRYFL